jgi:hypothetical protein|nr:MAG TPA: hypothetical protein [Bacteriophage sp.]
MDEKLTISNMIEGHDEYEFDLSKRIYMFSCLRDYKLCNYVIDWLDQLRKPYGDWSYDMGEGGKLTYDSGEGELITLDNSSGRLPYRRNRDDRDISLSNSYEVEYLGYGRISIEELTNGHKLDDNRLRNLYERYGNVKDKHLYFRNIESMKAPLDQMNQLDEIFKIVLDNPTCKVFLSTVSPYIANYFNVEILKHYEELGDKFAYYMVYPPKEGSNRIGLKNRTDCEDLDVFDGSETFNLADTYELSEPMEMICDRFDEEERNYKQRTGKF